MTEEDIRLIEGQIIHYVAYNNRHLAGMIIGLEAITVEGSAVQGRPALADLVVFTNMSNVNGIKNFGMQFHQDVEHSEEPRPGTWHYVERV